MQVWEVTAQLFGLAGSVALLRAIESSGKPEAVLWVWGLIQVHFCQHPMSCACMSCRSTTRPSYLHVILDILAFDERSTNSRAGHSRELAVLQSQDPLLQ